MRIDVSALPAYLQIEMASRQQESGLCFEDIFLARPFDPETDGTSGSPAHAYSFNAFGLLGIGGSPAQTGQTFDADAAQHDRSPAGERVTDSDMAVPPPFMTVAGTDVAGIDAATIPPLDPITAVAPTGPSRSVSVGTGLSRPGDSRVTARIAGGNGSVTAMVSLLRSAILESRLSRAGMDTPSSNEPEAETRTLAGEAMPEAAAERAAEAPEGDVSVTVSESDGTLHVIAAASDLTEKDKLKIRSAAEEIAREADVRLGDFFLNGAALRQFPKSSDRSFPWQLQL